MDKRDSTDKGNHPPTIIKQLPLSVESRLSKLSSDENVFIQAASVYQEALKRAGYKHKLKYKNSNKYNSNNNNNQHICNSNDTKNDNNYNNNKFKFDHNDKWDKHDNNNNDNFNGYESKDSNDNNNNNVKFYSNDNRGNINNHNNYNSNSNDNRDNIKNKDTNNNNNRNNNNNNNNNNNMESNYNNNPRKRNRNIIWFNPPFSKNVATKIGRYFLNLLDKHFPQDHKFHKIFNRNNIKVSYSCMPNIKSAINSHNRKILHSPVNNQSRTCNCINKANCPLQEKCLSENTLYQADISSENFQTKIYYGISETKFKTRYSNHKKSFNHEKHKNDTQLSNELWKIKASKEEPVLVWKILGQYEAYNVNTKRCLLCLNEKLQIAIYRGNNMLNKRTEIISKCRHRNKYALASYDSMD